VTHGETVQEAWDETMNPPKGCKHDGKLMAKGEDVTCLTCGDTWKEELPTDPELETPVPPEAVGKTYMPGVDTPATTPAHTARCCIAIRLKDLPSRNLDKGVVTETLHRYVVGETRFGAVIKDAVKLHDDWWDLLVEYSIHIAGVYEVLLAHEWIHDGVAKPAADFGIRTSATA